ncbi:MAG: HIT family protein [Patescibacteria group bacterium]|nr:HIT family protein [Patescibacteria group bacterium]
MEDCIFCKIVKGEIPCSKIYENADVLAFLDIAPVNIGHALIIPKQHFVNIYETPENILVEMMKAAKIISKAIKSETNADGINVTMNNDPAAGQVIFHSHIHVIPRLKEDGFGVWHGRRPYNEGEKEEVAKKIIAAL